MMVAAANVTKSTTQRSVCLDSIFACVYKISIRNTVNARQVPFSTLVQLKLEGSVNWRKGKGGEHQHERIERFMYRRPPEGLLVHVASC
jgi:hypothetical protein